MSLTEEQVEQVIVSVRAALLALTAPAANAIAYSTTSSPGFASSGCADAVPTVTYNARAKRAKRADRSRTPPSRKATPASRDDDDDDIRCTPSKKRRMRTRRSAVRRAREEAARDFKLRPAAPEFFPLATIWESMFTPAMACDGTAGYSQHEHDASLYPDDDDDDAESCPTSNDDNGELVDYQDKPSTLAVKGPDPEPLRNTLTNDEMDENDDANKVVDAVCFGDHDRAQHRHRTQVGAPADYDNDSDCEIKFDNDIQGDAALGDLVLEQANRMLTIARSWEDQKRDATFSRENWNRMRRTMAEPLRVVCDLIGYDPGLELQELVDSCYNLEDLEEDYGEGTTIFNIDERQYITQISFRFAQLGDFAQSSLGINLPWKSDLEPDAINA